MPRVLLIDNYDSFTYNLYQYMAELGAEVRVIRNDVMSAQELLQEYKTTKNFDRILISPGPGFPKDAGISCDVIRTFQGVVPIAGVCLGLQCMFEVYGGTVGHAGEIIHGKQSEMVNDGKGLFKNVPSPFKAIRYHSLVGLPKTLPKELEVTSTIAGKDMIMGVRHKKYPIEGVQFHPESILTPEGKVMIQNFLDMMFRKYDADKSGGIDLEEFKVLLNDLQIDIPMPKAQLYFKKCDLAQKGSAVALFTCDPTNPSRTTGFSPSKALNPKDLFAMFDSDDSGEIGRDEFTRKSIIVDVRKELNNRNIVYNKLLPRPKLAKKLKAILDKEDAYEEFTIQEAQWNFEWERTKERREALFLNAKRYAQVVYLPETLDAAGQVYVFGKGSFNRFDGPPAERDFVECPYFQQLVELWTERLRGADKWAPLTASGPEKKSTGWDHPKKKPLNPVIMHQKHDTKDSIQIQQLAFQNRVVAINTAWLWARRIKQVSCGATVAYALTDSGELYCWGGSKRTWDYIYASANSKYSISGARPFTARTEQLKLTSPDQIQKDEDNHKENYLRTVFQANSPPERPVESNEDELIRLLALIDYFELCTGPLRQDMELPRAQEIIEFDLRADLITNALRLRALQISEAGKFANVVKLSKYLLLELECMGEPFQRQMKRMDTQLRYALHNNHEASITSLFKKGASMWKQMRKLVGAMDDMEDAEFQGKQELWNRKRDEITRLRKKQAHIGEEGITLNPIPNEEKTIQASGITSRGPRQKTFVGHQALHEVSVGAKHALAIHQSGQLYGWGFGSYGRLGTEVHQDKPVPQLLTNLKDMRFKAVACGYSHSLALRQDGQIFVWGAGATGKLGLSSKVEESARPHTTPVGNRHRPPAPQRMSELEDSFTIVPMPLKLPAKIRKIACGPSHSAAITISGELYVWGSGDGGRLGLGDGRFMDFDNELKGGKLGIVSTPTRVQSLQEYHLIDVSCGTSHTATVIGRAFVCGSAHALGTFQAEFTTPPQLLSIQVTSIVCGNAHTAAVTVDGELYTWGNNVGGCTGHVLLHRFIKEPTKVPCIYQKPQNMARSTSYPVIAMQSTVNSGYGASLAIDGNTDGSFESTCCQTFREICPFWQIDLGVNCRIDTIRIWNRTGPDGDKLFPCFVYVGQTMFEPESGKHTLREAKVHSIHRKFKLEEATNPLIWNVPENTTGRYIRIQIDATTILSLAQVEVFGLEEWKYQGPKVHNVACGDDILVAICRPQSEQSELDKAYLRALCADLRFREILNEFQTFDSSQNRFVDLKKELKPYYRSKMTLEEVGEYLLELRPPKPLSLLNNDEESRLLKIYVDDEKPDTNLQKTEAIVLTAVSKLVEAAHKIDTSKIKPTSFLRRAMQTVNKDRLPKLTTKKKTSSMDIRVMSRPQTTPASLASLTQQLK
ncbi:regulator of chromosome condensation (RCC1) [Thraustotheca clavata]|uniref:Anthranilate synthase component 2 n=1 Tax=Thraustotheca clavata TaxID=74557 RepID=A0A1W0A4R1_9STRA|nr:regulator of chromosome condensation (RCC1) [Thraustotheca clavata]